MDTVLDRTGECFPQVPSLLREKVEEAIWAAVDEVNLQLPNDRLLNKSLTTLLLAGDRALDSLGLVNLIVLIEQKVEEHTGRTISLASDEVLSRSDNPFESLGTLVQFVAARLEDNGHG